MELRIYPDPTLSAKNEPIREYTPDVAVKVMEMFRVMYATGNGVGLAAPQVGWNIRLFILNLSKEKAPSGEMVIWNPTIKTGGEQVDVYEGCLSLPGLWGSVKRWTEATIKGMTPNGPIEQHFTKLGAQTVQHEMDHLDGLLFIERMSPAEQRQHHRMLKEFEQKYRNRKK